ncbi:MAG: tetratricopeptide repeat protein [Waddliaceae bacterium]
MATLEKEKRLSESLLWKLQTNAYRQFGPEAWSKKQVPFYITSNPLIAKQFAHVILGYIRDCLKPEAKTPIDPSETLYLFDLGAGSGRLSYLLLKHLLHLLDQVFPRTLNLCYVMTDMVESTIESWQQHPLLQPFFENKQMDCACYCHDHQSPLQLIRSGKMLTQETVRNPIILIGTYYFDTIPQDLFRANNGQIEEGRITITVQDKDEAIEKLDPSLIIKCKSRYDYFPIRQVDQYYPQQPKLNAILLEYAQLFAHAPFLFPIGGFTSLEYFSALSRGRLLLLAGDQGVCTKEQIAEWGEPSIFKHSSFSMAVSYHAIARYFRNEGGAGLLTTFSAPKFVIISGILGGSADHFPETRLAFTENIDAFEPLDYWQLTNLTPAEVEKLPLKNLLGFLKLGRWDPINFHLFFPSIRQKLPSEKKSVQKQFLSAIHRVWEQFYSVDPGEGDFAMNLGVLLFEMEEYSDALLFFQRALEMGGENKILLMNLSKCCRVLGDDSAAKTYFDQAQSLP